MVKHASSHGFAVLVCTVASAFLVETLKPQYPLIMESLQRNSEKLIQTTNIPLNPEAFSVVFIASLLAFIWGVFFKIRVKN